MTTLQRARRFIARRFDIAENRITVDSTLESIAIDSLARLELVFEIEEEFGIRLAPGSEAIATLGDLVAAIERELATAARAA